jgi:23S rRNA (adenine1618-N6)-methyltransferase
MSTQKKEHPKEKVALHPRNLHRARYDFSTLIAGCPELGAFVNVNEYGDESINFFDPNAVQLLNKALLKHFYQIEFWEIPKNYLCPPVPGRADYIHYVADLLANENSNVIPRGPSVNILDVGVGANCIYPIIGTTAYDWKFVGVDIDPISIASAMQIVTKNSSLRNRVKLRLQTDAKHIFNGAIQPGERFHLTICNPPFHASARDAQAGTIRKLQNLKGKTTKPVLNFGGQSNELWCEGGEEKFVADMIRESKQFRETVLWFTTLISKRDNVDRVRKAIKLAGAVDVKCIPMSQGNKASRIVCWTFLKDAVRSGWAAE